MHDRGRYLQDRKRRLWLQELFEQVHTANVWDAASSSEPNLQHISWSAQAPKTASSNKDFLLDFQLESTVSLDTLPQETNEEQPAAPKRKKRVCLGKWRESNKRRGWPCSIQAQVALRAQWAGQLAASEGMTVKQEAIMASNTIASKSFYYTLVSFFSIKHSALWI